MPLKMFLHGAEGNALTAFQGADTTFNITLTNEYGVPVPLSTTKKALIELFSGTGRGSTLAKRYQVTPDGSLGLAGVGTVDISDADTIARNTYEVYAVYDDQSSGGGTVSSFTITAGSLYSKNPVATIDDTGTGGSGLAITPVISGGVSSTITVTNGGSGYTIQPTVTFNTPPGGVAATATAFTSGGAISSISVTSAGSGYTEANPPVITITGGGGTGATATATVSGSITSVTITSAGTGYTVPPTITLARASGDTTGAGGAIVAVLTRGKVQISSVPSTIVIA